MQQEFVLFWRGPFSNWYPSPFVIHGTQYSCSEMFMMEMKARLFGDHETAKKILATTDPKEQKKLGRGVRNFNPSLWDMKKFQFVLDGLLAKFSQNPELLNELLATGNKTLVEASPYDTVWGIGLGEEDPDALDPSKWKGKNLLGQCLMVCRSILSP